LKHVVLVTGASSGIGAATCRAFVASGHQVIGWARREDRLAALAGELGPSFSFQVVDVTDSSQVTEALQLLSPDLAQISVLVNNAGAAFGREKAGEASLADWESMIDLNVKALVSVTHAVLQGMVTRNLGHIINLGSVAGTYPYAGGNVYGATKAFVEQFSLNLRSDLLGTHIRVTNIEPGAVKTDFSIVRFRGDVQQAEAVYAGLDALTAEDVAECIHWCANLPARMNINRVEVMPTAQACAGFSFNRTDTK
jgi:3-hydroxy acid dehydrogenase / malonic semialdehyde reductase